MNRLIFCTVLLTIGWECILGDQLTVETTSGWVKGSYAGYTPKNKQIYAWKSIPYAEPPVGNLRFEPPVPKAKWNGVRNASIQHEMCLQKSDPIIGSEDCLYLQIHTPKAPNSNNNLPVMVFIHGGAFWFGESTFENAKVERLLDEDVILVGIHYRVGVFGFLSTGDKLVPGNNGLKDQVVALKWIHANVKSFGGDPSRITLFGQSAGAAAIGYLLQTPLTKGLFSAAIIQSGSPLCLWAKAQKSVELTKAVGEKLGIKRKPMKELINKLKSADAHKLQKVSVDARNERIRGINLLDGLVFVPVIEPKNEGAIITEKSYELLANGSFHHVPIMTGFTSSEMQVNKLPFILSLWLSKYDRDTSLLSPLSLNTDTANMRKVGKLIKKKYYGLFLVSRALVKTSVFVTDDQFKRPITKAAELYSARTNVYFYQFSYMGHLTTETGTNRTGAAHSDDLFYLFNNPKKGTDYDYLISQRMVRMWTNFAKTSNPTPISDPLLGNVIWPVNRDSGPLKVLNIGNELTVSDSIGNNIRTFWDNIFETYGKRPYDTY